MVGTTAGMVMAVIGDPPATGMVAVVGMAVAATVAEVATAVVEAGITDGKG
ncbi:MAG TPA: hypothetical protein VGU20_19835 [Stellaceae bacterium]|nr:hypothetical protein [Stellaceae bacterium]